MRTPSGTDESIPRTDEDTSRHRKTPAPSATNRSPAKNIRDINSIITTFSYLCKQINYFSYPSNNKISNHQYPYTDENTYLPTSNRL